jgi:hypothetical protein
MGLACVKPTINTKEIPDEHFTDAPEPDTISEIDTEDWTDALVDAVDHFSSLDALVSEWQTAHPTDGLTDEELACIYDNNIVPWEAVQAATTYHEDEDNISTKPPSPLKEQPRIHIRTDLEHNNVTTVNQSTNHPHNHNHRELTPGTKAVVSTIIKDIKLAVEESRILAAFTSLQRLMALTGWTREEIGGRYGPEIDACSIATDAEAVVRCLEAIRNDDENCNDDDWLVSKHGAADEKTAAAAGSSTTTTNNNNNNNNNNTTTTSTTATKGLKIMYSHDKHSTAHKLKLSATFDHPIAHVLALAHEWDYLSLWNKFNVEAIKIAEPTLYESYLYGAQWSPPPFKNMQALVKARGFDLSEEQRCLFIIVNDTEVEDIPVEHIIGGVPSEETVMKRKRVNILSPSCIKLKPVLTTDDYSRSSCGAENNDNNNNNNNTSSPPSSSLSSHTTEAVMLIHVDPHIKYVPSMLVNFVLGILAPYIYRQMVNTLDSQFSEPDKPFPTRIREQPEFYGELQRRIKDAQW